MVKKILNNDTKELDAAKVALLDVSATWCQPCKMLAPVVEQLSEEFAGRVEFFNADSDENPEVAERFGVTSIPYLVILKDGKFIADNVGFQPAPALKSWIEANL